MGYALIVGGGTEGRYTISLDIGEAERAALVSRFTVDVANAQARLAVAQVDLNEKAAALAAAGAAYDGATAAYIDLLRGESTATTPEDLAGIFTGYQEAQQDYIRALTKHAAALSNKNALSFSVSRLTNALAAWQAQVLTETREAWCADYTEDAAGYVATMEIPGESELILIAPGGRAAVLATDGYLRSRGLMSPWQAFANAAILPGWQKFKPTYRWGTITALDEDADTATVSLAEARSSAQRLLVNQASTLINVPIVYMTCNAGAFEVGDNVVVEFQNQDFNDPRVIGFLDNPKECHQYRCIGNYGSAAFFAITSQEQINQLWNPGSLIEWRTNVSTGFQNWEAQNPDPFLESLEDGTRIFTATRRSAYKRYDDGDPNVDLYPNEANEASIVFDFFLASEVESNQSFPSLPQNALGLITILCDDLNHLPAGSRGHILELRVTLNGAIVCNIATREYGIKARTPGGITNEWGSPVVLLDDYLLFTEE